MQVDNGTKLLVRCPNIDYDYSVYYDEDATDGENVSQNYIVCVDGAFTEHTLACEKGKCDNIGYFCMIVSHTALEYDYW